MNIKICSALLFITAQALICEYVLGSSSTTTHPLSGQAGIFRHVLISAERSFIMKNGGVGGQGRRPISE